MDLYYILISTGVSMFQGVTRGAPLYVIIDKVNFYFVSYAFRLYTTARRVGLLVFMSLQQITQRQLTGCLRSDKVL